MVAAHPHITPLLAHLIPQTEFYVLAISRSFCAWAVGPNQKCAEVPVPAHVPKSFLETLKFDQPDSDLRNHAAFTRFGTGTERDLVHERLHHYMQLVDREFAGSLKNAPLVLVGTAEELAIYRSVSGYPRILSAEPTSTEHLSWVELGRRAQETILNARRQEADTCSAK